MQVAAWCGKQQGVELMMRFACCDLQRPQPADKEEEACGWVGEEEGDGVQHGHVSLPAVEEDSSPEKAVHGLVWATAQGHVSDRC